MSPQQQNSHQTTGPSSQNSPTNPTFSPPQIQDINNWRPSPSSYIEAQPGPSSTSSPRQKYTAVTSHQQSLQSHYANHQSALIHTHAVSRPQVYVTRPTSISTNNNITLQREIVQASTRTTTVHYPVQTVARSSSNIVASGQPTCANPFETQPYTPRTYQHFAYPTHNINHYQYYPNRSALSHQFPSIYSTPSLSPNREYYPHPYRYQYQHNYGHQPILHHYPNQLILATHNMSQQQQPIIESGPRLIWLLFMHRHGDRAPLNMAPRDKYNNTMYWPEGFGNLNNAGRLRMFKLGKYIRRRYENFLTDNIREVYSRSSDVDRCIESSHAVLAGCYPPTNRFEWNKQLLWIPAPVHTVPAPEDYLLNEAGRKYMVDLVNEIHIVQSSEAVKQLYEDSVKERALLEKELGYEYDMFYKFKCTYSTLDIEERNGLEMPIWYTPELKQKLYRFAGIAFGLAGGGTEKLKKIRCSHLLDDMVSRMEMASVDGPKMRSSSDFHQPTNAPSDDDRKIVHYSTHDSIMAAFLEALNINAPTPVPPGFGATFFIELYVDLNEQGLPMSEKYIKLFYMDDTDSEKPVEKKLPAEYLDDKGRLTLKRFRKYVGHLLPDTPSIVM